MKINKAIKSIMKQRGVSYGVMGSGLRKVNKRTGEVTALKGTDVSARLMTDNLSFDKAVEMLTILGYEIVIQEKKPGARRADQIVVDQKDIDLDALLEDESEVSENVISKPRNSIPLTSPTRS